MGREFLLLLHLILLFASAAKSSESEAGVNGSVFIPFRFLESNRNKSSGLQDSNVRALETFTLDERCKMGRPLSLAWYQYPPYTINQEARLQSTEEPGLVVQGMLPDILRDILESCCNKTSRVTYGKLVESSWQINDVLQREQYDFAFPVHIFDDASRSVRGRPFVAIVQAPRVVLLVLDESPGESQDGFIVFLTISHAWPMLAFLLLMALLASVIIWFLDHSRNPQEFPPSFLTGVWEGFWWALVTMTTVGYGDRSPKSFVGRLFSIVWILGGVCLLSIFTALVSSSLSASTQPNYKKHGAVIGAVNGSNEYRLGVTLNADMQVFSHVEPMILTLSRGEIDGALVDNYVITHHLDLLSKHPIRIEEQIKYPVTYGVALARNSSGLETCARRYIRDHPQEVFETFSKHLTPLKNPTDYISSQSKAAERLFFKGKVFSVLVYGGLGTIILLFCIGIVWEFSCRRQKIEVKRQDQDSHMFSQRSALIGRRLAKTGKERSVWSSEELKELISKYQVFHHQWIEKFKAMKEAGMFQTKVPV